MRWIENLPIWAKASATSIVLLLCLLVTGGNAYLTINRSAEGLAELANGDLPKERALGGLIPKIMTVHVKIYRFVQWSNSGIGANLLSSLREEISSELQLVGDQLQTLIGTLDGLQEEQNSIQSLPAVWSNYRLTANQALDIAAISAPASTMSLEKLHDEFQTANGLLDGLSATLTGRSRKLAQELTAVAATNKSILIIVAAIGVFISGLAALFVSRSMVVPIQAITQAMRQVSSPGCTTLAVVNPERRDEIGQMVRVIAEFRQALEAQALRFDTALCNMSQGLCMFDAEQRLVVCNERYAEIYHLPAHLARPGTHLRDILEHHVASGLTASTNPDFHYDQLRTIFNDPTDLTKVSELNDGRAISVSYRPMENGGWVATHEDVTERRRTELQLARQNELLSQNEEILRLQNLRFDAALCNMSQGLAMFDCEERLVLCNERYAKMYHLTPEMTAPGTTSQQITEFRIAIGTYYVGISAEDHYRQSKRAPGVRIRTLQDGRVVALLRQPMAEGGWVTTHEDVTEQHTSAAKVAHMAKHDALTDLANRVLLRERLEGALAGMRKADRGVALHMVDLDRFKEVNDTLGHPIGDALLQAVAVRLRACVRLTDTIARLGGDEFAIIEAIDDPLQDASALATRVIAELSRPFEIAGNHVSIGASIGIALSGSDSSDPDQLLKKADLALYRAKADGRGIYCFFAPEMDESMQARRKLEADLRNALVNGEFELHYQPLVNLEQDAICGFEALLRWHHPTRGTILPGEFIQLAEETGLILPIGEWVLRQACAEAANWPMHLKIAVNISPSQFRARNLADVIVNVLAKTGMSPERLELELTESVILQNEQAAYETMRTLQNLGVRIALDDFGTGYSSLHNLRMFPFDKIKIDRSFVKDLSLANVDALAVVRAVAKLGVSLGMATTAEGVETKEQLDHVRAEGCTEIQGYYICPPSPAHKIARLIAEMTAAAA